LGWLNRVEHTSQQAAAWDGEEKKKILIFSLSIGGNEIVLDPD
jgi:hypothetical protein